MTAVRLQRGITPHYIALLHICSTDKREPMQRQAGTLGLDGIKGCENVLLIPGRMPFEDWEYV